MGKILFYQWNAFMQRGIEDALKALHIDYDTYYDIPKNWDKDVAFSNRFIKKIEKENLAQTSYDMFFGFCMLHELS